MQSRSCASTAAVFSRGFVLQIRPRIHLQVAKPTSIAHRHFHARPIPRVLHSLTALASVPTAPPNHAIMPSADRALPGGGPAPLITLKTHPPLPAFSIPHRVPDPSADISSFKLSILRILTGQTNAQSSTKPLTFSEEVKEKAINGWKMQMLTLELRQRDDLEAEDPDAEDEDPNEMRGFELQDHHECSLIEEGDQIVVRLKPAHTLQELELPKLPEAHRYSAPTGSLTRAGTLSEPPPYSIIQPSEPSSFSSSVGAQPNANYHQHRYQDYRQSFRVVTATNVGSGHIRRSSANNAGGYSSNSPVNLAGGLNLLQSSSAKQSGPKNKRRTSAAAVATTTATTKPSASPKLGGSAALPTATTPSTSTQASASTNPSTAALPSSTVDLQHVASPPTSPRLDSGAATPVSASATNERPSARRNSSSTVNAAAQRSASAAAASASSPNSPHPDGRSSGFLAMPATALVIGPGVQGQVGRNPNSVNAPIGSLGGPEITSTEYGNARGFVGFTSAVGGELRAKPRRRPSKQNSQEFNSAAAADAAEKRAALARRASNEAGQNGNEAPKRPVKERQASSSSRVGKTELPIPPVLPPIQNLAPFPEMIEASERPRRERDLPPMPTAADEAENGASMVAVSAPTESRPPRLSFLRKFSSATNTSRNTDSGQDSPAAEPRGLGLGSYRASHVTSTPIDEMDAAIKPALDGEAQNNSLTRAERRYLEVQKALADERDKQAEAEKLRAGEIRAQHERKQKEREKKEAEAKKRAEEQKWQMWEEVRRRQKTADTAKPVPPGIQRLYSGATADSNGSKDKSAAQPVQATRPGGSRARAASTEHAAAAESNVRSAGTNGAAGAASTPCAAGAGTAGDSSSNGASGPRIELGLERITRLLARLGSPHTRFPVIHVAGTNGKGSTIAYLDAVLRNALDIRTGTFVSPHLIERRDCCKVNGAVVSKPIWRLAQSDVLSADQGLDIPASEDDDGQPLKSSPFELLTAQTFQAFALLPEHERPEVLLIEVGLGGRLDATNVFGRDQVLASVICPIDRDHEAFLGSELAGIAREKAGIVKDSGLCIIADQRLEDVGAVDQLALGPVENESKQLGSRAAGILDAVRNVCIARGARLVKTYIPWKLLTLPPTRQSRWGAAVDFTPRLGPTLFLSTSGMNPRGTFVAHPHDPVLYSVAVGIERTRANLTGVCMAVQTLSSIARDEVEDGWGELRMRIMWGLRDDAEANVRLREALNAVHWAGRCSWHTIGGVDVLVDGAHNAASALALREYIDACLAARALSEPVGKGKAKTEAQFEVTYVLAFSEGKDYEAMVRALLEQPSDRVERNNVALTTFSPPEGMPWVRSVELDDALRTLKSVARTVDVGEIRTFPAIAGALEWAEGKSAGKGAVVVAGSLYLVADMYRLLQQRGLYSP